MEDAMRTLCAEKRVSEKYFSGQKPTEFRAEKEAVYGNPESDARHAVQMAGGVGERVFSERVSCGSDP